MREIQYVITDELGIHARPAGQLVKLVSGYECDVKAGRPEKMVDAKRIIGVMGLAIKKGETLTMTFDGPDEEAAAAAAQDFLRETL